MPRPTHDVADRHESPDGPSLYAVRTAPAATTRGLLYLALATLLVHSAAAGAARRVELEGGAVAAQSATALYLEAPPEAGEGLFSFTARHCGSAQVAPEIAAANGGVDRLLRGVRYRVPFDLLLPELQLRVVRALFPEDQAEVSGWEHQVTADRLNGGESLWEIAAWFTGEGANWRVIRDQNRLADEELQQGQRLIVPAAVLLPAFRSVLPAPDLDLLTYTEVEGEEFAVYRLRAGEALYSSVVVRFTGRMFAEDVNTLAAEIAHLSEIADVTDIPIGYPVKIPLSELQPEFLPADHPRRIAWEQGRLASEQFTNPFRADRLEGVTVVLDAGHGGRDVGASMRGVWESIYVYDIMLRVRRLLETMTVAQVYTTTRDGSEYEIPAVDVLAYSRGHRVLTDPPYPVEDPVVGVNLRWYLANSIYRDLRHQGVESGKIIFISIHADSLHPSLRGAMVYIPGAALRGGSYGKSGAVYTARREVREVRAVGFTREELTRSEGLSRQLAERIVHGFERTGLTVHPYDPVRDRIVRSRNWVFVPAVLRYNEIPASVLVEVCNLANREDLELIQTHRHRERVAEAVVHGILDYYGYQITPEMLAAGSVAALGR